MKENGGKTKESCWGKEKEDGKTDGSGGDGHGKVETCNLFAFLTAHG